MTDIAYDINRWSNWVQINMRQFAAHVQGKAVLGNPTGTNGKAPWGWKDYEGIVLDDGSAIVSVSKWTGPYSRETPDIDAEPPHYYLSTQQITN
tara:strand:+ start:311 stop:592 length:282 start_codon:yes stop_codon:yes gene_type:complete